MLLIALGSPKIQVTLMHASPHPVIAAAGGLEEILLGVAEALLYPVLILALLALVVVLVEVGSFVVELVRRRRRSFGKLGDDLRRGAAASAAATRSTPAHG